MARAARKIEDIRIYCTSLDAKEHAAFFDNKDLIGLPFLFSSKLREQGFLLSSFDQIYIYIESVADVETIFLAEPKKQQPAWARTAIVTIPEVLPNLSLEEQHEYIVRLIAKCATLVCTENGISDALVQETCKWLLNREQDHSILLAAKETNNFEISVLFECKPSEVNPGFGGCYHVHAYLSVLHKKDGRQVRLYFFEGLVQVLAALVDKIVVKNDVIHFKQRQSDRAKAYLRLFFEDYSEIPTFRIQDLV